MVCEKCGTQIIVGEKFCPKCGTQAKMIVDESQIIWKKILIVIILIILVLAAGLVYYIVFLIIGARFIMPALSPDNAALMISIIFIFSIIGSISTVIPIYFVLKNIRAKEKDMSDKNKN
jgi:hypothetical protein